MSRKKKPLAGPQITERLDVTFKEVATITEENCINCRFHIPGKCRRFPPTHGNRFSEVRDTDLCGEWRSK